MVDPIAYDESYHWCPSCGEPTGVCRCAVRIVHFWDGYGNLCNTTDGRRNDAQSSADVDKVTCTRCRSNLEKIGKLPPASTGDAET